MYVRKLELKNVKLIRDASLSFLRDGDVRRWTVLVGENGLCKTAILQCIALAASGRDRGNQLHEDAASFRDIRLKSKKNGIAEIAAEFTFGKTRHTEREYPGSEAIKSTVEPPILIANVAVEPGYRLFQGSGSFWRDDRNPEEFPLETVRRKGEEWNARRPNAPLSDSPLESARSLGSPHWFVAGYGVSRALSEPLARHSFQDPVLDRLKPLFDRGPLIGTGFIDLFENTKLARAYAKTLRDILLKTDELLPRISGVELRGRSGVSKAEHLIESNRFTFQTGGRDVKVPATWLSQGYQSTIAWIADLVGQIFWETGKAVPASELEGLVLIDELDLHLHPKWQVVLVQALKAALPNVQFVVTTHSPMILPGLEQDELYRLRLDDEGNVCIRPSESSPTVMTAAEIYDLFFGLDSMYPMNWGLRC